MKRINFDLEFSKKKKKKIRKQPFATKQWSFWKMSLTSGLWAVLGNFYVKNKH